MSVLRYDFEKPQSGIFSDVTNPTIQAEKPKEVEKIDIGEFLKQIHLFTNSLNHEDYERYRQAKYIAKTCNNNRDSYHIWSVVRDLFIESIRENLEKSELDEIRQKMNIFDKKLSKDVDNGQFRIYLIGILEGLL